MLSSKVIDSTKSDHLTLNFSPPAFEVNVSQQIVESELSSPKGAFELDKTQKEIAGLEKLQKEKIEAQVQEAVLRQLGAIQEEAFNKGFELGQEEGRTLALQQAAEKIDNDLKAFNDLVLNLQKQFENLAKQNESRLMELVFKLGSRLAAHELSVNREAVLEVVRQTVGATAQQDEVTLEIHPDLLQFFEELQSKAGRDFDFLKKTKIDPNPNIEVGGCVLRTQFGQIDAQLNTRIENLWSQIAQVLPQVS